MRTVARDASIYSAPLITTPAKPDEVAARRARVLAMIDAAGGGLTTAEIADKLKLPTTTTRNILDRMMERGELSRSKKRAAQYFMGLRRFYKLIIWHRAHE